MFCKDIVNRAVVHYLHFTRSLRKVSALYGASAASLSRWVRKRVGTLTESVRRPRRGSATVQSAVESLLSDDPFQTLSGLVGKLKELGIASSKSAVHRNIKVARLSRKRAAHRFAPKAPTPSDAQRFLDAVREANEVVSIDETSVILERKPLYGYSLKGTRPVFRSKKPPRGNRVTLLLAVSNKRGVIAHRTFNGSCNRERFAAFLQEDVDARGAAVTLDNVRFHHSPNVKRAADSAGLQLVYTPPYSPDFNFIENAFSIIKSHTRRLDASEHLQSAIETVTPAKAAALYRHMVHHVRGVASA